jgi:hypothetical protein
LATDAWEEFGFDRMVAALIRPLVWRKVLLFKVDYLMIKNINYLGINRQMCKIVILKIK